MRQRPGAPPSPLPRIPSHATAPASLADTGYWACGIFSILVIYLNLFIRQLDDPFAWPQGFWFESYVNGDEVETTLAQALTMACNVDLVSLFVDFGYQLRELLRDDDDAEEERGSVHKHLDLTPNPAFPDTL